MKPKTTEGKKESKKELLKLPERDWSKSSVYESVMLVPTGRKHDSGYMLIAIVGVVDRQPKEIAAYCDDVCWAFPENLAGYKYDGFHNLSLRTDSYYPSGIMHIWSNYYKFEVGSSLSSTDINLIPIKI